MTTDLGKRQLAQILSALDGTPRNPANREAALKTIGQRAASLGLTLDAILAAAPALLDGTVDAAAWKAQLTAPREPRRSRADSKQAQVIALLQRPEGATVEQLIAATGWQAHTVRGALSGALKKRLGLNVTSARDEAGQRVYRIEG